MPPDWAFGAQPPTLGKCVARWAMHLYLGLADTPSRRYTLNEDELDDWKWLPESACAADRRRRESWLTYDVCDASKERRAILSQGLGHAMLNTPGGAAILSSIRGNTSLAQESGANKVWIATEKGGRTSAGLWVASQMVRMVRRSLGACSRAAVAELNVKTTPLSASLPAQSEVIGARHVGLAFTSASRQRNRQYFTVAIHVRRGDACERWAADASSGRRDVSSKRNGRPCFRANDYLRGAHAVLSMLYKSRSQVDVAPPDSVQAARLSMPWRGAVILLASDSPHVAEELLYLIRSAPPSDGWQALRVVDVSRGIGWGAAAEGINLGKDREAAKASFIETRNAAGLINRTAVFASLFADLALLSMGQGFVGTAASWTSRLILLALAGERNAIPPFALLDKPLGRLWFA